MAQTKTSQRTPQRVGANREQTRRTAVAPPSTPTARPTLLAPGGAGGRGRRGGNPLAFIRDVRSELRKVSWPTGQQTLNLTVVVIALSVAVGIFLGGVDFIFQEIFRFLIGATGG